MKRSIGTALTAMAAMSLLVAGCANTDSTSNSSGGAGAGASKVDLPAQSKVDVPSDAVLPKGDGKAKCSNLTIGYVGAVTGDNAQLGINIFQGAQLAIDEHNKANPDCQVKFTKADTEGVPDKATGPVTAAVKNSQMIGVVGLPFSGESKATGNIFEQGGMVHITPAATNPGLTENGWKTFFRGLGNDAVQGPAVSGFAKKLKAPKVYVIQDDSDYGIGLGTSAKKGLGGDLAGEDKVATKQRDFSAVVSKVMNAKPDAVFYAGYYAEGAPLDQQLVAKGFKGTFIGPDGVKDDAFIKQAGSASNNAYFTCPCIPGELIPSFNDAYQKAFKMAPGTYSIEGYDATTVLLAGIDKGNTTRPKLLEFVKNYDANGLSKKYKWNDKGELDAPKVYGYKVDNGKIVSVGEIGG